MGDAAFTQALRDWLNEQTGGLLQDQIGELTLDRQTILALATTIYFRAKWAGEFREENTAQDVFHGAAGDVTVDFMHKTTTSSYYWGEQFGAVGLHLENGAGTMWFLLPDEGCARRSSSGTRRPWIFSSAAGTGSSPSS